MAYNMTVDLLHYEMEYSDFEMVCTFFRKSSNEELIKVFGSDNLHTIFKTKKKEEIENAIFDYIRELYDNAN